MCLECNNADAAAQAPHPRAALTLDQGNPLGRPPEPDNVFGDSEITHGPTTFMSNGEPICGYFARPETEGCYPAIVILHGNAGIPEDIRYYAAFLAREGFCTLVIDAFSRDPDPSTLTREFLYSFGLIKRIMRDVEAGIAFLRAQMNVAAGGVGLLGFCGGGITSLMFSTLSHDIAAVVALYASPFTATEGVASDPRPHMISFVDRFTAPIQCHYGTNDAYIPMVHVARFTDALRAHKVDAEVYIYEGAGHGFCNYVSDPDIYDPDAAALVQQRLLTFFTTNLLEGVDETA